MDTILHAQIQLVSDNITSDTIKAINIINSEEKYSLGDNLKNISNQLFDVRMDLQNISDKNLVDIEGFDSLNLIIGFNLIEKLLVSIFYLYLSYLSLLI